MTALRAVQHLEALSRDYPGTWKSYARFLSIRNELGDWPAWCYCPMAAAYAVVAGDKDSVPLDQARDIGRMAALAAWRPTQGIYRIEPTLLGELLQTPLDCDLPVEHLQRLPEWCVYVELGGPELMGFFAHLEYDVSTERTELRFLLDQDDGLVPLAAHLGGTIEQSMAGFVAHANAQMQLLGAPFPALDGATIRRLAASVTPLVSVLLYLCSPDAEMRPTRDPKRTHAPARPKRNRKGELQLPPARRPEVWETGFELGAALRQAAAEASSFGRTPRGHIRRAHWHSYWVGSAEDRRLEIRWLPPIAVKLQLPERPTVHHVKG